MDSARVKSWVSTIVVGAASVVMLFFVSRVNYLLFHTVVELFSIVVAMGIFILAWNARTYHRSGALTLLGIAYLTVAGLDLLHTLAYEGMGMIPGATANLSTQLWIATRGIESVTLLLMPLWLGRQIRERLSLSVFAMVGAGVIALIFAGWFPVCFVPGQGLTGFKIISEYVICALLLGALGALWAKRKEMDRRVSQWLAASIAFTVASEIAFTQYVSVFGLANFVGHILKVVSFFFIYKAILETGIVRPFELLFRDLKRHQASLETARDRLEDRVERRTAELREANVRLQEEIAERAEVEKMLRARERQLQVMMRRVVTAQEEERARLSRELHDEAGQSLTLLTLCLGTAEAGMAISDGPAITELRRAEGLAQRTMERIRRIAHGLRPPALDTLGLRKALHGMCEEVEARSGVHIEFLASPDLDASVPHEIGTATYRVVQEALANVAKHAEAQSVMVDVQFHEAKASLHVVVEDDGRGFDAQGATTGAGLLGVRERVESLGGSLRLSSAPGRGTRLLAHIPIGGVP